MLEILNFHDITTLPHDEQHKSKQAMELIKENDVWDLEELPMNKNVIFRKRVLWKNRECKLK